ncbi:hypothetical protein AAHC03_021032 [Spirometra sp. Aus1]
MIMKTTVLLLVACAFTCIIGTSDNNVKLNMCHFPGVSKNLLYYVEFVLKNTSSINYAATYNGNQQTLFNFILRAAPQVHRCLLMNKNFISQKELFLCSVSISSASVSIRLWSRGLNDSVTLEDELSYNVTEVDASAVVTSVHTRDGSRVVGVSALSFSNLNKIILQKINIGPPRNLHPRIVWAVSDSNLLAGEAFALGDPNYCIFGPNPYAE